VSWSVGVATGSCVDTPIVDILEVFHDGGVRGLVVAPPPRHFDLWKPELLEPVVTRLQALQIAAVSIHAPFGHALDLAHPHAHHREAGIHAILLAARAIRQMGGSLVVVHPSDLPRTGADITARLESSAASLRAAADGCRSEGVRMAIESPLPHLIGGHPDEFAWILKHVDANAGVCLDTGHIALGRAWQRFMEIADGRLVHVHASDNHGHYDDHLPPGEGTIDWRTVLASLRDAEFAGWVMLELRCPDVHRPDYFRQAVERTHALERRVGSGD
jgi:sugar phosphate isomerase/epimerase